MQCIIRNTKCHLEKESIKIEQTSTGSWKCIFCKKQNKETGKLDESKAVFTFVWQQFLSSSSLTTSVAFYKHPLWTYNLTMYNCANNRTSCCMWYEAQSGRGSNQVNSCLYKELLTLPPNIKHVTFYSDTCGDQNKNNHIVTMFMTLMQNSNFEIVEHTFLK
ncbi:unnamed protein product [Psylliodes chrysocephalus]|uniref:Uncharacterized protein n=1 Tax=Psylliodes chrysocephalus TaxID=3402493 RepID=A0A9P0CY15_9CUCU|nr:unnamed protein product [Psylliodes chrysocephala]